MEWKPASALPGLGVRTRVLNNETHLATVYEGEAAHAAGLSAGDILVAINDLRVTEANGLDRLLQSYQPGDTVLAHVFRRDELRSYLVKLGPAAATECVLKRANQAVAA
jgi:predicted metalloprotease with PDZ domain